MTPDQHRPVPTQAERITAARADGRQLDTTDYLTSSHALSPETTRQTLATMYVVRDRLSAELAEARRDLAEAQATINATSQALAREVWQTPSEQTRVVVVVDWTRQRVHGITADDTTAQRWTREIVTKHGDPLAATMTAGLVDTAPAPGSATRAEEPDSARALRTGLDHSITYLAVTHRRYGLHDVPHRCEGCEVLGDLEQLVEAIDRTPPADAHRVQGEHGPETPVGPGQHIQPEPAAAEPERDEYHWSRAWGRVSITCACTTAPCGYIVRGGEAADCDEHGHHQTMRGGHPASRCPGGDR